MIGLTEWLGQVRFDERPWLILGKGPTFARRDDFDLGPFNLLALNHVVEQVKVDVAHIIDVDVVEACAESLETNCKWLLMPRVPHVGTRPSLRKLEDFVEAVPALRRLDDQGRLVWYNAATTALVLPGSPVIGVRWFSSEAALNLLGEMGVRRVRSLGVDGGQTYASAFGRLNDVTRLANGLPSFDAQFSELDQIVRDRRLDYEPLVQPVRVFVGTEESQAVATRVLAYSIRRHTDEPVRVSPMEDLRLPRPKHRRNRARTAFSFARFAIPQLCGYKGRAIYLDADMQVFGDIAELWNRPFGDHLVQVTRQDRPPDAWRDHAAFHAGPQMSVMVLDCSRLDWDPAEIVRDLDEGRYTYEQLMFDLCVVPAERIDTTVPVEWNHLEQYQPGLTRLVHYTVIETQPWKSTANPLGGLWMDTYREAVKAGAVPPAEVERLVTAGHMRAELLDALKDAHAPARSDRSSTAIELDAARRRIEDLEGRRMRARARRIAQAGWPLVRRATDRAPAVVANAADRLADGARRLLR